MSAALTTARGGHRRGKRDGNHPAIVKALKDAGRAVLELHGVGGGCPDLLVSWPGGMVLLEVKDPQGRNRVEESQSEFARAWCGPRGSLVVVRSVAEALRTSGVC